MLESPARRVDHPLRHSTAASLAPARYPQRVTVARAVWAAFREAVEAELPVTPRADPLEAPTPATAAWSWTERLGAPEGTEQRSAP